MARTQGPPVVGHGALSLASGLSCVLCALDRRVGVLCAFYLFSWQHHTSHRESSSPLRCVLESYLVFVPSILDSVLYLPIACCFCFVDRTKMESSISISLAAAWCV